MQIIINLKEANMIRKLAARSTRAFYDYARTEWVLIDDTGNLLKPEVLGRFKNKNEVLNFIK